MLALASLCCIMGMGGSYTVQRRLNHAIHIMLWVFRRTHFQVGDCSGSPPFSCNVCVSAYNDLMNDPLDALTEAVEKRNTRGLTAESLASLPATETVGALPLVAEADLWSVNEINKSEAPPGLKVIAERRKLLNGFVVAGSRVFKDYTTYELAKLSYCKGLPFEIIITKYSLSCTKDELVKFARDTDWHASRIRNRRKAEAQTTELLDCLAEDMTVRAALMLHRDLEAVEARVVPGGSKELQAEFKAKQMLIESMERFSLNTVARKNAAGKVTVGTINIGIIARSDPGKAGKPAVYAKVEDLQESDPTLDAVRSGEAKETIIEVSEIPPIKESE